MKIYLALFCILLGSQAFAQYEESGTVRGHYGIDQFGSNIQRGFAGYLGINAGYVGYNRSIDVEGAPTSIKLIGSYVTPYSMGVFDIGYGIQSEKFSQNAAKDGAVSTGVLELAARYQFESKWQLGGVYNQFFNKGDTYSSNQADTEFAGVQLLREFGIGQNYIGRVGGRIMTSLNVNNESINMAVIDFQMGFGGMATSSTSASN